MPWTVETPATPGWYWLRRAAFRSESGAWHEPYPIIVELRSPRKRGTHCVPSGNGSGLLPE